MHTLQTSTKGCQSLLLVGGLMVSISRLNHPHNSFRHSHNKTLETAGQAKPVSVKARSSLETGVFFEVVSLGLCANPFVAF